MTISWSVDGDTYVPDPRRAPQAEKEQRERQFGRIAALELEVAVLKRQVETLLPAQERAAILAFVARVNARAERDILKGNPITGAHHRALQAELAALEEAGERKEDRREAGAG